MRHLIMQKRLLCCLVLFQIPTSIVLASVSIDPGADHFANATPILNGRARSLGTYLSTKSSEPGEPSHSPDGFSAGRSAWWKWTAPKTGWCTVDTLAPDVPEPVKNTVLAVYTGSAVDDLVVIGKNDDAFLGTILSPWSRVTFRARQGVTYHIAVDAKSLDDINASSPPYNLRTELQLAFLPDNTAFRCVATFASTLDLKQHGVFTASKTASNSYSGRLNFRGRNFPVRGQVLPNGQSTVVIRLKNDPAPIVLHLDFATPPAIVYLEKDQVITTGQLKQSMPRNSLDEAVLGRHSQISLNQISGQHGLGSGSFLVRKSGTCAGVFILPDGVTVTASGEATDEGIPGLVGFHACKSLHKNKGSVLIIHRVSSSSPTADGALVYDRPPSSGSFYPAGFTQVIPAATCKYSKPAAGRFAGALNASGGAGVLKLLANTFPGDAFPGTTTPVSLSEKNRFIFGDASMKGRLTFNLNTGLITGSIQPDPDLPAFRIRATAFGEAPLSGTHFLGHYQTPFSTGQLFVEPPPP